MLTVYVGANIEQEVGHQDPIHNDCTDERNHPEHKRRCLAWYTQIFLAYVNKLHRTFAGYKKKEKRCVLNQMIALLNIRET